MKKVILKSINNLDDTLCVDIFERSDGSFGFEEYRRELENYEGWYKIGLFDQHRFNTKDEAYAEAKKNIKWFRSIKL